MTYRRQFTAEFKAQVVLELLSGAKSSAELCREHQIAASVLTDWKARFLARAASLFKESNPRDHQDTTRIAELERLAGEWPTYGYRRITVLLQREQIQVNRKHVARLMRETGIQGQRPTRRPRTTSSDHAYPRYPNLVQGLT